MPNPVARHRFCVAALLAAALAAGVPACASLKGAEAPACQGARRPGNPYGSVLEPAASATAAAAAPTIPCGGTAR